MGSANGSPTQREVGTGRCEPRRCCTFGDSVYRTTKIQLKYAEISITYHVLVISAGQPHTRAITCRLLQHVGQSGNSWTPWNAPTAHPSSTLRRLQGKLRKRTMAEASKERLMTGVCDWTRMKDEEESFFCVLSPQIETTVKIKTPGELPEGFFKGHEPASEGRFSEPLQHLSRVINSPLAPWDPPFSRDPNPNLLRGLALRAPFPGPVHIGERSGLGMFRHRFVEVVLSIHCGTNRPHLVLMSLWHVPVCQLSSTYSMFRYVPGPKSEPNLHPRTHGFR